MPCLPYKGKKKKLTIIPRARMGSESIAHEAFGDSAAIVLVFKAGAFRY